jgi:hypothetical protein
MPPFRFLPSPTFSDSSLFAPGDFRNEENYVKMQLAAVASLAVAAYEEASKLFQHRA